jgi:hypothetical protein
MPTPRVSNPEARPGHPNLATALPSTGRDPDRPLAILGLAHRRNGHHATLTEPWVPDEGFFRAGRTRPGPRVHAAPYGASPGGARSEDGASRRPRWDIDAGITERDVAALYWLGQQYAARSDVLRVLLGRLSSSPNSPMSTPSASSGSPWSQHPGGRPLVPDRLLRPT